ncbi:MAG TPA: membrane dipeptidase [Verrucomicrobiae bacterium]|nr:membrane dipeptidase [Verrucomicrobiae bacterium]
MNPPFFLDAHLDLALNAIEWNRDLTRPIAEIRAAESGMRDKAGRGRGTVCLPEMRRGRVGLAVVTQLARVNPNEGRNPVSVWQSPAQAWAMTQGQLAWYRALEEAGEIKMIVGKADLEKHVALWQNGEAKLIGCILSLEGADSLITLRHLEKAHAQGLRAVGLAHYGPGRYAHGTQSVGGLPAQGRELLAEMDRLGMIMDVTHLSDDCFWEALKNFSGPVWASHHNCRALVPHQRQLAEDQIRALLERDAVIGAAMDGWMIVPNWVQGETTSEARDLRLEKLVEHIDHVCQIAGNTRHVGLGSDLDGGFGGEQSPCDLDTIADVGKLCDLLRARGWSEEDLTNFAHGNFLRILRRALP